MNAAPESTSWYDAHAGELAQSYEAIAPEQLHGWLQDALPSPPALILDVGAGTGRDAAWLARMGHSVVAVEPSHAMRTEGQARHAAVPIIWIEDQLPALPATYRRGLAFDLILLSGVWQHVAAGERERAMHPVSLAEVERLAREQGAIVARVIDLPDQQGRADISWTGVLLRLPDDGTGALPLLRHIILNDLLRALCRAADGQAGLAEERSEGVVVLPLGLIALNWLRLYLPLVETGLPQGPGNAGPDGLGFAGPGFRALLGGLVSRLDLRVGARFAGESAQAIRTAIQEAADLITKMPATYMTYPNKGGPVLPVRRQRAPRTGSELVLNGEFLAGFGDLEIPRDLWRALGRFAAWIEPALVAEWMRIMRLYAARQGRTLDEGLMGAAMTWSEPSRDVALPRGRALALLESGKALHCVWSGRRLQAETFDIDHCLPWSAWPCGDLWNLLPAHRQVNQREKRDGLPGGDLLRAAAEPIQAWWQQAYFEGPLLHRRFIDEARASLPGLGKVELGSSLEDVFAALRVQRLRLRHDQQVPEWTR